VAIVERSLKASNPPKEDRSLFVYTPVEWEYWPVSMVAREGQHSGLLTKPLENVTPRPASSLYTTGIDHRVSQR
jgi:hypothetical protein